MIQVVLTALKRRMDCLLRKLGNEAELEPVDSVIVYRMIIQLLSINCQDAIVIDFNT